MHRIVATSDWHFGRPGRDAAQLRSLANSIEVTKPDIVLALGDLVDSFQPEQLRLVFGTLAQLTCPVGVVFGNHDVTVPAGATNVDNSWNALDSFCEMARQAGLHPLDQEPMRASGLFVCGTGGWYDYSLGDPKYTEEQYALKRYGDAVWPDEGIQWGMADQDVSNVFLQRLDRDLTRATSGVAPVVATHMATLPGSLPVSGDPRWDFLRAYMGSRGIGEIISKHGVKLHLHGHFHAEGHPIPDRVEGPNAGFSSHNVSCYEQSPFFVCERDGSEIGWVVRPGELATELDC